MKNFIAFCVFCIFIINSAFGQYKETPNDSIAREKFTVNRIFFNYPIGPNYIWHVLTLGQVFQPSEKATKGDEMRLATGSYDNDYNKRYAESMEER
jgi:hypothetical protein